MYYIFGSENSQDYDVMVFVDDISPTIDDNHFVCKSYNNVLSKILTDKSLNCNIGVLKDGIITKVFKGDCYEVNNAIIYTYDYHQQEFPLVLNGLVDRDVHTKLKRVVRGILSFYSRSSIRSEIKAALRGDLIQRLEVLKKIDLSVYYDFKGKKESYYDILKVLAFQYGQLFSLYDGFEHLSYTKNGISTAYPDLKQFMDRDKDSDISILEQYKQRLIKLIETELPNIKNLYE